MARYESSVKQIPHPQGSVFAKLSDLNNLAAVREKFSDPDAQAALQGKLTGEQVEAARRQLESMEFTADTVSFSVPMMGGVSIRVVDREPDKCVKLESVSSPIPLKLWIQILPTTEAASKLKLTLDALKLDGVSQDYDKAKVIDANESPKYRLELWNCYGATRNAGCAFGTPEGDVIKNLAFHESMEAQFTVHSLFAEPEW